MDKIIEKLNEITTKIGNTPVADLGGGLYAKIEGNNPAGSVKDRVAFYIIKDAIISGALKEGTPIVEATSGNTGIGLAYVAGLLGIKVILTMPESMSLERRNMLAGYGAELVLTPASDGMNGAVIEAEKIVKEKEGFFADQFGNYSSVKAHYETTAPEIFTALPNVKKIVAGVGSGGTVMGIKKYILEKRLDCKVIAVEPAESPLMSEGCVGKHLIQGIGANFIPRIMDVSLIDEIITIKSEDAVAGVKEIYERTGMKCGISSGAAYLAARARAERGEGKVLAVFPDSGDRYPSALYE